eukprot:CAMPEP_0169466104 /NCGR_PEP_ID=MMETSP1042-20121227/21590_1 /TAXON_ID=464988 /ORGANISM="Hemiselmis andersenii, Strain CCMP1180" /LENGTH=57 /DNA_ID=CAMNT_0009579135 /DNA_START=17 /DNA_END=187 /DNA_ORIENTATION=-
MSVFGSDIKRRQLLPVKTPHVAPPCNQRGNTRQMPPPSSDMQRRGPEKVARVWVHPP